MPLPRWDTIGSTVKDYSKVMTRRGRVWSKENPQPTHGWQGQPLKTHIYAFSLLLLFGAIPLTLFFILAYDPWAPKTLYCTGQTSDFSFGETMNGSAIQGIFIIDALGPDQMTFATAKFVDVVWDLCVGRGAQALSWFISYVVFSKALIHAIEVAPIPFRSFTSVAIDGSSLMTFWTLLVDIRRQKSKRMVALFIYLIISIGWMLAMPTLLSAMTGYVSSNQMYLSVDSSLIDMAEVHAGQIIEDGERVGLSNGTCVPDSDIDLSLVPGMNIMVNSRRLACPCEFPNGTVVDSPRYGGDYVPNALLVNCTYNTTTTDRTFPSTNYTDNSYTELPCTSNFTIKLNNEWHNIGRNPLNLTRGGCFRNQSMPTADIDTNSRCLPSGDNAKYYWGFSSMLGAIVVILQFVWAFTMYALWFESMVFSTLVKQGMKLSQLRGAFAVTAAAQERLEMGAEEMVGMPEGDLKRLGARESVVERRHLRGEGEGEALRRKRSTPDCDSD
ncbi:hypothetical protein EJ05DRAFT_92353 [Pseudovirgaria hyperparasitica]|uniref:Uncharacterized protein n=1 Tax=Pseudovirgaria hyperparasitica TaxID=470096 RepID=A0A6A6W0V1_9PEZI|nr:uncharacterized protein EJ05DRAFT_92353 [Pseudovirgaria hyperparasitica]KAF2756173.1 hypothetical protein EJ05DRAFT_92353 [Pseudovirgaria hyperparasitica]